MDATFLVNYGALYASVYCLACCATIVEWTCLFAYDFVTAIVTLLSLDLTKRIASTLKETNGGEKSISGVLFERIKRLGMRDDMFAQNGQPKVPSGENVRSNGSEEEGSQNLQKSNEQSQHGEKKSAERVAFGDDTNKSHSGNFAAGQHAMQQRKRSTGILRAFDAVKSKIQTAITSGGTKSVFQFEEKTAPALFDILQAKVAARSGEPKQTSFSWAAAKVKIDMTGGSDAEQAEESMLQAAMLDAAELDLDEESEEASNSKAEETSSTWSITPRTGDKYSENDTGQIPNQPPLDVIEFAPLTMKWLERADKKGREMLLRRVKRLAEGHRSYALSKRLQSTQNPIYEAKLGGQRILWTKLKRGDTLSILVSFDCLVLTHAEKYLNNVHLRQLLWRAGVVCQPSRRRAGLPAENRPGLLPPLQ